MIPLQKLGIANFIPYVNLPLMNRKWIIFPVYLLVLNHLSKPNESSSTVCYKVFGFYQNFDDKTQPLYKRKSEIIPKLFSSPDNVKESVKYAIDKSISGQACHYYCIHICEIELGI